MRPETVARRYRVQRARMMPAPAEVVAAAQAIDAAIAALRARNAEVTPHAIRCEMARQAYAGTAGHGVAL